MQRITRVLRAVLVFSLLVFSSAHASVVLKVVGINPSAKLIQRVPIKAYLPKEVSTEHIIDLGDLEVGYDNQQGSYYVFGEYELGPGETLEREIEIEDIWVIPQKDIDGIRSEIDKAVHTLEEAGMSERIIFLRERVYDNLNKISQSQKVPQANPEQHILLFRENSKRLDEVKSDLVTIRTILIQAKRIPPGRIWKLFVGIIIFLALLSVGFYFFWRKQFGAISEATFVRSAPHAEVKDPTQVKGNVSKDSVGADDIEKIINNSEDR